MVAWAFTRFISGAMFSMKFDARKRAFQHLLGLFGRRQSLAYLLTAKDAPLTRELCFGVSRHYFRLSAILDQLVDKRPKELEVWVCLLMGIYQLDVLKKPAYATVKETVDLLENTKHVYAKGFVNAVLRRFEREQSQETCLNVLPPEIMESPWLTQLLRQDWPEDWLDIIRGNGEHAPMILRVNLGQITRDDYLAILEKEGVMAAPHAYVRSAILLKTPIEVEALPGFLEGDISVQDVSAQCAVELLSLQPRMRVLDACAAPGGKTCQMLEQHAPLEVVALDKDQKRLERVFENLQRLKLSASVVGGDGIALESWWDGEAFDRILLDAPCSATGVIRRHPDIRVLRTLEEVQQIASTQASLLTSIWKTLAEGGKLLYVTCSVLRQENDEQIELFLKTHKTASSVEISLPWGRRTAFGWQCLPGESQGDGFYYALLEKSRE